MRASELLCGTLFCLFLGIGWMVPLDRRRRIEVTAAGLAGLAIVASLPTLDLLHVGGLVRDLMPALLLVVFYRQSGRLITGWNGRLEEVLRGFDRRWLPAAATARQRGLPGQYLEVAYLACYPVVPLGVVALHMLGRPDLVESFWRIVLPATLVTHAATPFFPSRPPWMLDRNADAEHAGVAHLNRWVRDNASIRANSFPSGHASSTFAVALVLTGVSAPVGAVFLWVAVSVAIASVVQRYHYLLDVLLGIAIAGIAWVALG